MGTNDERRKQSLEKITGSLDEVKNEEMARRIKNSSVFGTRSKGPRSLRELPEAALTPAQRIQRGLDELTQDEG